MQKTAFDIVANNNELILFNAEEETKVYHSYWYMEFGKMCAEISDTDQKLVYHITKKFQFWKWRMVYLIENAAKEKSILIAQNSRNTIFSIELPSGVYEIRVHYRKKKSIYKNDVKIAEFDETLAEENQIKLLVSDSNEAHVIFLLYVSLLIGINDFKQKSGFKSQKKLEKNVEAWF